MGAGLSAQPSSCDDLSSANDFCSQCDMTPTPSGVVMLSNLNNGNGYCVNSGGGRVCNFYPTSPTIYCIVGTVNGNVTVNIGGNAKICFRSGTIFNGNATINVQTGGEVIVSNGASAGGSSTLNINGGFLVNCSPNFNPSVVNLYNGAFTCPCNALPVEIVSLKLLQRKHAFAALEWEVAEQNGVSHYSIKKWDFNTWVHVADETAKSQAKYYKEVPVSYDYTLLGLFSYDFDGTEKFLASLEVLHYKDDYIHVYPIPASSKLNGLNVSGEYCIVDILGNVQLKGAWDKQNEIDISGLSSGLYFLHTNHQVLKFIKI